MEWIKENKKGLIIAGIILVIGTVCFLLYRFRDKLFGKISGYSSLVAAKYLKKFEGFTPTAVYDVNAWRIGHGSDTITFDDGTYRKVVQGDVTTEQNADKDLQRRIDEEFIPLVKSKIGEQTYNKWGTLAQAAFVSFAYNYGTIKNAIADAAQTMDKETLAKAWIDSTINDNQSQPYNIREALKRRRLDESKLVLAS